MIRSQHTIALYRKDAEAHKPILVNIFEELNYLNYKLYENEAVEPNVENWQPFKVGISIIHYARLRIFELDYNFFDEFSTPIRSER